MGHTTTNSKKEETKDIDQDGRKSSTKDAAMAGGSDLEQLRDILFGNQARATEERLGQLERQVVAWRRELSEALDARILATRETASSQLSVTRSELLAQLEKQAGEQSARQKQQSQEQADNLENTRKDLLAALDKVNTELQAQLQESHQALSDRLDRLDAALSDRLLAAQDEARQRNADLRQELLTLTAWLDDKKTSRHDLGQMLQHIGQQLQQSGAGKMDNE